MEKIKVLIVEDNKLVSESLSVLLQKHDLQVVGVCESGEDAVLFSEKATPDLILMDIALAGAMDGISAAHVIQQKQDIPIVYLSDHADNRTFERAKKTMPANYLTKPFQELDLIRAIDIGFSNANEKVKKVSPAALRKQIFVRVDPQSYVKLAYHEILFLEADRAYCHIVTMGKKHTLSISLNHVLEQLDERDFMRIHRKYAVNITKITAVNGNMVKMGDHEIQVSKEYRDALLGTLNIIK